MYVENSTPPHTFTGFNLTHSDRDLQRAAYLANAVTMYTIPVIIAIGVVGNIVSLLVLLRTYMRRLSISVYLASLALADTCFLATLFITWFEYLKMRLFHREGICQITLYASYVSRYSKLSVGSPCMPVCMHPTLRLQVSCLL